MEVIHGSCGRGAREQPMTQVVLRLVQGHEGAEPLGYGAEECVNVALTRDEAGKFALMGRCLHVVRRRPPHNGCRRVE